MKSRRRYARWIEQALYDGRCAKCAAETKAGARILYMPDRKALMCERCGEKFKADEADARRIALAAISDGSASARQIYESSDGALTRRFLAELRRRGPVGVVAALLFRAQKSSSRAKKYGPTSYRGLAYERKGESLKELVVFLCTQGETLGITFGWGRDEGGFNPWVLYVELPSNGMAEVQQVSFHSPERYEGPNYPGEWDGKRQSEERIISFCQQVLKRETI